MSGRQERNNAAVSLPDYSTVPGSGRLLAMAGNADGPRGSAPLALPRRSRVDERSRWTEADRQAAESRLAAARQAGDVGAEIEVLIDVATICRHLGDAWALVTAAQEAWTLAERSSRWDQLARLALLFGDIAYSGLDYLQCYDHYANACAYASMAAYLTPDASRDESISLAAVVARVDAVIDDMLSTGRSVVAQGFCDLLIAYEAAGGIAQSEPELAEHFRERLRQVEAERSRELAGAATPN